VLVVAVSRTTDRHEIGLTEATVKAHRGQAMRKDAGKVIGRAGQNGRQAESSLTQIERVLDQGLITSLLLLKRFRRTGNWAIAPPAISLRQSQERWHVDADDQKQVRGDVFLPASQDQLSSEEKMPIPFPIIILTSQLVIAVADNVPEFNN